MKEQTQLEVRKELNPNMKNEWVIFKEIQGCLFIGIYANQLTTRYQENKDLLLHSVNLMLKIRKPNSSEETYWKIDWIEDDFGDDILTLKEQDTPEPLEYELINAPYQKYSVIGSGFLAYEDNLIKKVSGYGFKENHREFLSLIVLELEKLFISIIAGAVIETRITDKRPDDIGNLFFST